MPYEIKKLTDISPYITVIIGTDEASSLKDEFNQKIIRSSHIEGFRKGKAPIEVVATKIGREKYERDLREYIASNAIEVALKRKTSQVQKEKESDSDTAAYYITTFAYDSRDMLVEEKYQRWDSGNSAWENMYWARYKYDTAGNMVYREVDQIVNGNAKYYLDTFFHSRGYQLTQIQRVAEQSVDFVDLTYDANGNCTHINQQGSFVDSFYDITEMEFQFDEKNRMTQYRFGGSGSYHQIKYDALGRVRERVNLTPTTSKYYSDGRQLIQQLDNSDNVDFDYFRGPTGLMRQLDVDASNKKRFYIKDPLGTVLAMVNPSDLSVKHYNYNAWGEHLDKDDTDFPTDTNLMRYIGCRVEAFGNSTAQTDAIYHLDHRHCVHSICTFLQRDYLTLNNAKYMGLKPYSYANCDPTNESDVSGLSPCCGGVPHSQPGNGASPSRSGLGPQRPGPRPPFQPSPGPSPTPAPEPQPTQASYFCCYFENCWSDTYDGQGFFLAYKGTPNECCCICDVIHKRDIEGVTRNEYWPCEKKDQKQCFEKFSISNCRPGWIEKCGEDVPACDDPDDCAILQLMHFRINCYMESDILICKSSWNPCECTSGSSIFHPHRLSPGCILADECDPSDCGWESDD